MFVNGKETDSITIEGKSGVCVTIYDSSMGNLRIIETGKGVNSLQVVPQASNSIILTRSKVLF